MLQNGWRTKVILQVEPKEKRRRERTKLTSFEGHFDIVVIPGFVASDKQGLASTLSRYSTDFSAAIFAYILAAKSLTVCSTTEWNFSTPLPKMLAVGFLLLRRNGETVFPYHR